MAAATRKPPNVSEYDGRSVPPPPRVMRSGLRVMIMRRARSLARGFHGSASATVSPDAPVLVERFTTMLDGSARFMALDHALAPLLVTSTDGNVLVTYLREREAGRPRAVGH